MKGKFTKLFFGLILASLMTQPFALSQTAFASDLKVNALGALENASALPSQTDDGVILHAFDWSFKTVKDNLPQIAAAGYKSIQVSPVQGTKDGSKDPSKWWLLYQPTNQSIGNAQLGSSSDFENLCREADQYGISIIVDVVMNHMANNGNADELDSAVDPAFKDSSYYHNQGQCSNWNSRYDITQKGIGMPDLNTQNNAVQEKAITFLNQCIDAGADGFRFDAAKHIESNVGLDAGQSWSGNYWDNVLNHLKNKDQLYIYGEILQDGKVDNINAYSKFMDVSASNYGHDLRRAIESKNLSSAQGMGGLDPKSTVSFFETHDTYSNAGNENTVHLSAIQRKLGWSVLAARAQTVPLFFVRPSGSIGSAGDSQWKDSDIVAVNQFHNAMADQNEYLRLTQNNQAMLIDRGNKGTTIVNVGGNFYLNSPTNLADGTYKNHGAANCTLTVSGGTIKGDVPSESVIVLYNATSGGFTPDPSHTVDYDRNQLVAGQKITLYYKGALEGSDSLSLHWGINDWKNVADATMTKRSDGFWETTILLPQNTTELDFAFTNGSDWDNNDSKNWSLEVSSPSAKASTTLH